MHFTTNNIYTPELQIQDGDIYAAINQKDGMVRFLEDPEQYKTCEMIEHVDSSIQRYAFVIFYVKLLKHNDFPILSV